MRSLPIKSFANAISRFDGPAVTACSTKIEKRISSHDLVKKICKIKVHFEGAVHPGGVPTFSNFNGLVCPTGLKAHYGR